MASRLNGCTILVVLSVAIPATAIAASILLAGWFSFYNNALSDLGHSANSSVAPLFNFGIASGGILVAVTSALYFYPKARVMGLFGFLSGYSLVLVAVFDEAYGELHYWVSVLFFLSLAGLVLTYIAYSRGIIRRLVVAALLVLSIALWASNMARSIPPGVAIPETVSAATAALAYLDYSTTTTCRSP